MPTDKVDSLASLRLDPRRRPQRVDPAAQARDRAAAGTTPCRRSGRRPAPAPRTTTPTCRPATPARSPSRTPTTRGTAAASRSASWTPASTSDHPALQTTTHRRAQDRRLGHRHRPAPRRRRHLARRCSPRSPARPSPYAGCDLDRARRAPTRSTGFSESITAERRARAATSTATATRPTRWGVLYDPDDPRHLGRRRTRTRLHRRAEKMRPYRENFDVGHFGTDNPATAIAEPMPFVVEYREDVDLTPAGLPGTADFVNIGVVEAARTARTSRASPPANGLFGGAMDGAGARRQDRLRAGLLLGRRLHRRRAHRRHGRPRRQPRRRRRQHVDRRPAGAQRRQQRPCRALRHADQRLRRPAVHLGRQQRPRRQHHRRPVRRRRDVISVGASITRETWLANYGSEVTTALTAAQLLLARPARGRRLQAQRRRRRARRSPRSPTWQPGGPVAEAGYTLPPGYAMFNGTSMASPQTAGAAALLLSAAKATGIDASPRASCATRSTPRPTSSRASRATARATGQVDIAGAWDLLKTAAATRRTTRRRAGLHADLGLPGHPRPGHRRLQPLRRGTRRPGPGVKKDYQVKVTRTSGASGSVVHNLRLVGNDGTFSVPAKTGAAARQGHAGHGLGADDSPRRPLARSSRSTTRRPAWSTTRVLVTVVVSQDLVAPTYTQSKTASVERNLTTKLVRHGPRGCEGAAGQPRRAWRPAARPAGSPTTRMACRWRTPPSLECFTNFSAPSCKPHDRVRTRTRCQGSGRSRSRRGARRRMLDNPFSTHRVRPGRDGRPGRRSTLPSATAGTPAPVSWTVTNQFGQVER